MIDRNEALLLLNRYLKNKNLLKHSYAVEAIMKATAKQLSKNTKLWGQVGLLHDLDYEYTEGNPQKHANVSAQLLNGLLPEKAINAIKAHNYTHTDYVPTTSIDKGLLAADAVSGLIIATALVMPHKTLEEVRLQTLKRKIKDTSFAKGCDRKKIQLCTDIGITLDDFLLLSLKSLQNISDTLNL